MIPIDGGTPERLAAADAFNPAWSPKGDLIVYDIAPDGLYLVFDRSRQNSDGVLIDIHPR